FVLSKRRYRTRYRKQKIRLYRISERASCFTKQKTSYRSGIGASRSADREANKATATVERDGTSKKTSSGKERQASRKTKIEFANNGISSSRKSSQITGCTFSLSRYAKKTI